MAFAGQINIDIRNLLGYIKSDMIKSFKHKGVEDFFYTGSKRGIKPEHANRLERILDRLNAASEIKDMNYPGSFLHLRGLKGSSPLLTYSNKNDSKRH